MKKLVTLLVFQSFLFLLCHSQRPYDCYSCGSNSPSGGKGTTPSGGKGTTPSGGQGTSPSGGQGTTPSGGQGTTSSGGQRGQTRLSDPDFKDPSNVNPSQNPNILPFPEMDRNLFESIKSELSRDIMKRDIQERFDKKLEASQAVAGFFEKYNDIITNKEKYAPEFFETTPQNNYSKSIGKNLSRGFLLLNAGFVYKDFAEGKAFKGGGGMLCMIVSIASAGPIGLYSGPICQIAIVGVENYYKSLKEIDPKARFRNTCKILPNVQD